MLSALGIKGCLAQLLQLPWDSAMAVMCTALMRHVAGFWQLSGSFAGSAECSTLSSLVSQPQVLGGRPAKASVTPCQHCERQPLVSAPCSLSFFLVPSSVSCWRGCRDGGWSCSLDFLAHVVRLATVTPRHRALLPWNYSSSSPVA